MIRRRRIEPLMVVAVKRVFHLRQVIVIQYQFRLDHTLIKIRRHILIVFRIILMILAIIHTLYRLKVEAYSIIICPRT
jgi:hypothetical protein